MDSVLVVDDDLAIRELMTELLAAEDLHVSTAADGRACLRQLEYERPDLVLLDVGMPLVNGFEVCRQLKNDAETRLIPVILLTGLSAMRDRIEGLKAGADDFLSKPVDRSELLARVHSLLGKKRYTDELERAETVLFTLARSIEGKDPYTQGHCERLSQYSVRLAQRMNLPEEQVTALRRAGVVHDIGKVAVPDAILLKPAALTVEERLIIQEHPVVGERICQPLRSMHLVLPIIRHHHEKMDGTGYPDGLRGEDIPLTARVLQIVDVYDALTTVRPYKRAMGPQEALGVMQTEIERGWWDASILHEFKQTLTMAARAQ